MFKFFIHKPCQVVMLCDFRSRDHKFHLTVLGLTFYFLEWCFAILSSISSIFDDGKNLWQIRCHLTCPGSNLNSHSFWIWPPENGDILGVLMVVPRETIRLHSLTLPSNDILILVNVNSKYFGHPCHHFLFFLSQ